jgi:hypothetical protein
MEPVSPQYLNDAATGLSTVTAFLGGFAATYLATLLTLGHQGRVMTAAIASAAVAAVAFIVAVVTSIALTSILHPQAPGSAAAYSPDTMRATMFGAFFVGILALLLSVGLSGWLRSRALGKITTTIAAAGVVLIIATLVRV